MTLKDYLHQGKNKKIVFQVVGTPNKLTKTKQRPKFRYLPYALRQYTKRGRYGTSVKIRQQGRLSRHMFSHAKKGIGVRALVWFSENPKFSIFDDTDDYYPISFQIMFNRIKFEDYPRYYLLTESEALLYKL